MEATPEDYLVNQQIKDFVFDLHDASRRSHIAEDLKRLYNLEFKDLSDKYCDKAPWPSAPAVSSQCIGNDGQPDAYFLCVYKELVYRHMFAKLKGGLGRQTKRVEQLLRIIRVRPRERGRFIGINGAVGL